MAQTMTSMIKQLSKKYPNRHIDIGKHYLYFSYPPSDFKLEIQYTLYIEHVVDFFQNLTYEQLIKEVKKLTS